MSSRNHIATSPSDFSDIAEEIRRQLTAAKDASLSSEVGQQHETVLANIMLPGQLSGQLAPPDAVAPSGSNFRDGVPGNPIPKDQGNVDAGHAAKQDVVHSNQELAEPVASAAPAGFLFISAYS